ncbi:hypothetical protein BJ741DRAFT_626004 [Chytriomyces cf. hyalinus JEL632]|nr:hypothetical protein BJ741DRAFT_626004 [Chytriomyces cf. hyalinus JEL632]
MKWPPFYFLSSMPDKRILSVKYKSEGIKEVEVTGMTRLGELQAAIQKGLNLPVGHTQIELYDLDNNHITKSAQITALPIDYFTEDGSYLTVRTEEASRGPDVVSSEPASIQRSINSRTIHDLSDSFKVFKDAQLRDGCIVSPAVFPYTKQRIQRLYVRQSYVDIFDRLVTAVGEGGKFFGITGTPGIGKSLFFVYILYHVKDQSMDSSKSHTRSLHSSRVVYQTGDSFRCYELGKQVVFQLEPVDAAVLVRRPETLYIIDGDSTCAFDSSCVTLFIDSPQSHAYNSFVNHNDVRTWYLPVWTQAELIACHAYCYPEVKMDDLLERLRIYGGIPRSIFRKSYIPASMEEALADAEALRCVCYGGILSNSHATTHVLLHMKTSDDGQYQFLHGALASKYVAEKLWENHAGYMIANFRGMFPATPIEILRQLFKIYGHRVFSSGGLSSGNELQCRNLQTDEISILTLLDFGGERAPFKQAALPGKILQYHELPYDDEFPVVDSLSPQGLFQFAVTDEHPIQDVETLKRLCALYEEPPKLYYVVPPQVFTEFEKQEFLPASEHWIDNLEQYVVELPVSHH